MPWRKVTVEEGQVPHAPCSTLMPSANALLRAAHAESKHFVVPLTTRLHFERHVARLHIYADDAAVSAIRN